MFFGLFGKHRCKICDAETKDRLFIGEEERWLCRRHLIENFADVFLAYPDKMVIFHPEFEKVCKSLYSYYALKDLKSFNFDGKSIIKIEELLSFVNGKCSSCQKEANALYFPKGVLAYSYFNLQLEKVNPSSGELLCAEHALAKFQADLGSNPCAFDEGLHTPYNKIGIYVSTYL
jgi:hypothetical protein